VAASLLNVGRQVGGAIGLAVLGTVAWTVVADNARAGAATRPGQPAATGAVDAAQAAYRHALAVGFDRAFLVAAAISLLMVVVAITMVRVRRSDREPGAHLGH
jgi:heme/copper-type cytochrome/quinol oxidase subunit 2